MQFGLFGSTKEQELTADIGKESIGQLGEAFKSACGRQWPLVAAAIDKEMKGQKTPGSDTLTKSESTH